MNMIAVILAIGAGAAAALIWVGVAQARTNGGSLAELAQEYETADALTWAIERRNMTVGERVQQMFIEAGVHVDEREAMSVLGGAAAVGVAVMLFGTGNIAVGGLFGAAIGVGGIYAWLRFKAVKRLRMFESQLVRALTSMSNLMESGRALPQALAAVAKDTPAPLGEELEWVNRRYSVGEELPDALAEVAKRVPSEEFRFFVTAVDMNRTAGADLVGVIGSLTEALTQRIALRGEMRARLAEVQMTKYVVASAPAMALTVLAVSSPESLDPLFNTAKGLMVLSFSVVMWAIGVFITNLMTRSVRP